MVDHLIRYLRRDGVVPMFDRAKGNSDADALRRARRHRPHDMKVEVWNGERNLEVFLPAETDEVSRARSRAL